MNKKFLDPKNQVDNLLKSNGFSVDESIPWTDIKKPEPSDLDELKELAKKHRIITTIIVVTVILILATIALLAYLTWKWKNKAKEAKNDLSTAENAEILANRELYNKKRLEQIEEQKKQKEENAAIENARNQLLENKLISPENTNHQELRNSLFITNTQTKNDELKDFSSNNLNANDKNHISVQYIKSILQIEISSERDQLVQLTTLAHKTKDGFNEKQKDIKKQYAIPQSKNTLDILIGFLKENKFLENLSEDNNQTTNININNSLSTSDNSKSSSRDLKKLLNDLTNPENKNNYELILDIIIKILNFSEIININFSSYDDNPTNDDSINEYEKLFNKYLKFTKEQIAEWLIASYNCYTNQVNIKFDQEKIKFLDGEKVQLLEKFNKLKEAEKKIEEQENKNINNEPIIAKNNPDIQTNEEQQVVPKEEEKEKKHTENDINDKQNSSNIQINEAQQLDPKKDDTTTTINDDSNTQDANNDGKKNENPNTNNNSNELGSTIQTIDDRKINENPHTNNSSEVVTTTSNQVTTLFDEAAITNNNLLEDTKRNDKQNTTKKKPKLKNITIKYINLPDQAATNQNTALKENDETKIDQAITKLNKIRERITKEDLENNDIASIIQKINTKLVQKNLKNEANNWLGIRAININLSIQTLEKILNKEIILGEFNSEELKTKYGTYRNYTAELINKLETIIIKREEEDKIAQEIQKGKKLIEENTKIITDADNEDFNDEKINSDIQIINKNLHEIFEQANKKNDSNSSIHPALEQFLKKNQIEEKKPSTFNLFNKKNTVTPEQINYIDSKNPRNDLISLLPFLNVEENKLTDGYDKLNESIENLKTNISSICSSLNKKHEQRESQKKEKIEECKEEIKNNIDHIQTILENVLNFLNSDPVKNFIQKNNSRTEFQKLYETLYEGSPGYTALGRTIGKTDPLVTELENQIKLLNTNNLTSNLELPSLQKIISRFKQDINTGTTFTRKNENILDALLSSNSLINQNTSLSIVQDQTTQEKQDDTHKEIHKNLKSIIENYNDVNDITLEIDHPIQNNANTQENLPDVGVDKTKKDNSLNLNHALELIKEVNNNLNEIKTLEDPKRRLLAKFIKNNI